MDFKNRLILFFILIAVIPIAALSAVFTVTVIEFKEHLSAVYSGFVTNLGVLSRSKGDLLEIKSDLIQYVSTQDAGTKSASVASVKALKNDFSSVSEGYKKIEDLPGGFRAPGAIVVPVSSYNIPKMASDEALLVGKIGQQWKDFREKVDDWAILSSDPTFAPQATASAGQLVILADRLVDSYDTLIELNTQIGAASREQSQMVMQLAFFYGGIASAISAACATAAAILVSKRVVLGDLVRMSKLELVETSLRDLIGGGADALVSMVKSQMSEEKGGAASPVARAEVQSAVISSDSDDDIVIGRARTEEPTQARAASTKAFLDEGDEQVAAPSEFRGKLVMINVGGKPSPQAARAMDVLFSNPNLLVLTRKGSNIYNRAPGRALVWVLAQDGLAQQSDARTVPSADEAVIAESISEIIKENPSATVLVDSATELIYTLGFEKVFSLLRRVSESVSSYPDSSVVVLVNKKAHEQRIIEAIGSVANEFVD
ncbi:MAG: hypothetical protein ABI347_04490 [Nitrososphaera sp.]